MPDQSSFLSAANRFVDWYRLDVLPYWFERCLDPVEGGYFEALNHDGTPAQELNRRIRVQSRQTYVTARIADLSWHPNAEKIGAQGFADYTARCFPDDGVRGCAHTLSPTGDIIDEKRDLYDQAFVLLACAWRYRSFQDRQALALADKVIAFLDQGLKSSYGGWAEDDRSSLPRRQNPHMHLFEAFTALFEATGNEKYGVYADHVFDLFTNHFYDREHHVLREFFNEDFSYAAPPKGDVIEPGHMVEWVWLLHCYANARSADVTAPMAALFDKAITIGREPDGIFLVDSMNYQSPAARGQRRLWPQTEFIKACCALAHRGRPELLADAGTMIDALFETYFNHEITGLWCDQYDDVGNPIAPNAPASILYHLLDAVVAVEDAKALV